MIRILIYDDVAELRESLTLLFSAEADVEVLGAFDNCETAAVDVQEMRPDVVLMDIDMPNQTGIEGVRAIREVDAAVKIIMLTVFDDNKNVFESLKAGANGYLLKRTPPMKLVEHVREVFAGGAPMTASIATQVLNMFASFTHTSTENFDLTEREKQVLQLLVEGNSYKMVGAEMHLSIDTIRSHIRNIYEKLQVHSKSEAVAKALRNKIV
jgi:DNA-binding NarL/FixJ family response regulator